MGYDLSHSHVLCLPCHLAACPLLPHCSPATPVCPSRLLVSQLKSSSSRGIVPPMGPNRTAAPPILLCQHLWRAGAGY